MALACGWLLLAGCDNSAAVTRVKRTTSGSETAEHNVLKAIEYLEHIDDFDESSAYAQAAYQLNRWLDAQKVDLNWQPDEMASRLPRAVRDRGVLELLPRRRFDLEDVAYAQECVWMRQVAHWVSRQPVDPLMAGWLDSRKAKIGELPGEQLGIAYRLFDWTVRNIQLDELLPSPDEATAAPAAGAGEANSAAAPAEPAAIRGLPGPGYQFEPAQALLYGHGDAWLRMRLFTLLARQQGLDVVTLAFPGRTIPPRPRPWVSAVLAGDQLYLFNLQLGLPVLSKDLAGVATLADVLADPSLIKNPAGGEAVSEPVAAEDLAEVVALIDVLGPGLSQRMQLAEQELIGDHRTVFSVPISRLASSLRACRGISDVYLWSIPFEATWFRTVLERRLQNDQQAAAQHFLQYGMFLNRSPLVRGRIAYFRSALETQEEQPGAKALFIQARISDANLKDLESSPELQKHLGIERSAQNEQQWLAQLAVFKGMLTRSKQHASFWLGMCQLESGRPDAAVEWLRTRTLETWPDGPWTPLARYNLARACEWQGDFAQAQRLLLADKSLQEHGNYLRARLLEGKLGQQAQPSKAEPAESGNSSAASPKTDVSSR